MLPPGSGRLSLYRDREEQAASAELPAASARATPPPGLGVSHRVPHGEALNPLDVSRVQRGLPSPAAQLEPGGGGGGRLARTYAGSDGRTALLVALGTAVAGDARHAILAGTLACGLIAGLAGRAHGVAIAGCGGHTTGGSEGGRGWLAPPFRSRPALGHPIDPTPGRRGEARG